VKIWYCSIQARTSGEGAFASVEGAGSRAMIRLSIGNQLQDGQGRTSKRTC
jgi:hypothetical protein